MRTQRPVLGTCLGIAYIAMVSGCAAFSDHDSGDSTARLAQPPGTRVSRDVAVASHEESVGDEAEDKSLSLGDFAPSKIGTTVKQLSGYGPNHELARQLYGEAEETYGQAVAARVRIPRPSPAPRLVSCFLRRVISLPVRPRGGPIRPWRKMPSFGPARVSSSPTAMSRRTTSSNNS